jgi:HPt (histidine-containing phosphotransfer) domain-containing protein
MAEKEYSLDYLNSISGGDQEFVKDMVQTFISNAPEEINKIRNMVIAKNWQKVGEDAHRFASSLLFLGLDKLKTLATEIEEMGLQQNNVHHIPALLDQLEQGCGQIIEQLKRDFNE